MVDINEKYVVYYAVRGYATGQTVTIDIFDTVGGREINSQAMSELNSTGIYTFNFFPRKRTSYLAVTNCPAKPRQTHEIIRVKQQKIGGAVRPLIVKDTFTPEEKKELFKRLEGIHDVPAFPDNSKELSGISAQLKELKFNDSLAKRRLTVLLNNSKKSNADIQMKTFENLSQSFMSLKKELIDHLDNSKTMLIDELRISTKIPPVDLSKIESYLNMIDDINLLVKNGIA